MNLITECIVQQTLKTAYDELKQLVFKHIDTTDIDLKKIWSGKAHSPQCLRELIFLISSTACLPLHSIDSCSILLIFTVIQTTTLCTVTQKTSLRVYTFQSDPTNQSACLDCSQWVRQPSYMSALFTVIQTTILRVYTVHSDPDNQYKRLSTLFTVTQTTNLRVHIFHSDPNNQSTCLDCSWWLRQPFYMSTLFTVTQTTSLRVYTVHSDPENHPVCLHCSQWPRQASCVFTLFTAAQTTSLSAYTVQLYVYTVHTTYLHCSKWTQNLSTLFTVTPTTSLRVFRVFQTYMLTHCWQWLLTHCWQWLLARCWQWLLTVCWQWLLTHCWQWLPSNMSVDTGTLEERICWQCS